MTILQTFLTKLNKFYNNSTGPIGLSQQLIGSDLKLNFSDISIVNHSLNWGQSFVRGLVDSNEIQIDINNANLQIANEYSANYMKLSLSGPGSIKIDNLSAQIIVKIVQSSNKLGFTFELTKNTVKYDKIIFTMKQQILSDVINAALNSDIVKPIIDSLLSINIKSALSKIGQNDLVLPLAKRYYTIQLNAPTIPQVVQNYTSDQQQLTFLEISLNVKIINDQGQSSNYFEPSFLKMRNAIEQNFLASISNNAMSQLLWTALDSQMIDITINNSELPPNFAIQLDTTGLAILFPNIVAAYGANKYVYMNLKNANTNSVLIARGGRVEAVLDVEMTIIVDTDGANYPQNVTDCTSCQKAVDLKLSIFAALYIGNFNQTVISANVIDLRTVEVNVNFHTFDVDQLSLQRSLDLTVQSFISVINQKIQAGIQNPLIGKFDVSQCEIAVSKNSFLFQLGFQ